MGRGPWTGGCYTEHMSNRSDIRGTAPELCDIVHLHPARVAELRQSLIGGDDVIDLAETFRALGDPTRVRILDALSHGELCVCDLAALVSDVGISRLPSTPAAAQSAAGAAAPRRTHGVLCARRPPHHHAVPTGVCGMSRRTPAAALEAQEARAMTAPAVDGSDGLHAL